ncbi:MULTISPECIES: AMP-binding protein [unclassified Streptomyces]|uniref:AMP-binding protein n=1 Tax=unclassified Streptomyces TaxID=2593676 RepID=UPI00278C443B|nr:MULTISPECIES: AMP-binding protein [unclassified Streptomyces]
MTDLFTGGRREAPPLSPALALPALLDDAARRHGARTALIGPGRRRTGFRALRRSAVRVAAGLARLGVRPGERVALLLPDCRESVVVCHAVWRLGAVVVPLDPARRWADTSAVVVVAPRGAATEVSRAWRGAALRAVVAVDGDAAQEVVQGDAREDAPGVCVGYGDLDTRHASAPLPAGPAPGDLAVVLHPRDGTPVGLRHRNLVAAARQLAAWHGESGGRVMSLVPVHRAQGLVLTVLAPLLTGSRTVLAPRDPAPLAVLRAARRRAPTLLAAPPAALRGLLDRPAHEREALATVRTILTAPLDPGTGDRARAALDARVVEAYGPEAAAGVALANPPSADARPGTVGLPLPGTEVRIAVEGVPEVDVLPGHAGELLLRGPQLGHTTGLLVGGWLRTGRLAVRGPDGYVTLLGRTPGPGVTWRPGPGAARASATPPT